MRARSARPFTLFDAMGLIAATALGVGVILGFTLELLGLDLRTYPPIPRALLKAWSWVALVLPLVSLWMTALFLLSLKGPRPPLRRLTCRPGFAACTAVALVVAVRTAGALSLIVRTVGTSFYTFTEAGVWDRFTTPIAWNDPVRVSTLYNASHFAASGFGMSVAVASAWLLLALGGRWRPEASWIDRLGRALEWFLIGVIPLSCWWDSHVLF